MDEEVVVAFFGLFAKWAWPAILPTTSPQSICCPKPILQYQPSVVLQPWWSPRFSNNLVNEGLNKAKKSQLVCGSRGVLPIARELPPGAILHILN
jgi:hypothetical protein